MNGTKSSIYFLIINATLVQKPILNYGILRMAKWVMPTQADQLTKWAAFARAASLLMVSRIVNINGMASTFGSDQPTRAPRAPRFRVKVFGVLQLQNTGEVQP